VTALLYSEQFDQSAWQKLGDGVVTPNVAVAPNGLTVADKIASAAGSGFVQQNVTPAVRAAMYTASVWLRSDSTTSVSLRIGDSTDGTPTYMTTVSVTTAWQRFSISYTVIPASSPSVGMIILLVGSGYVYAWGAQITTSPTATPYVPTTSSPVNPDGLPLRSVA
jgi:Carbohydrate binding domain